MSDSAMYRLINPYIEGEAVQVVRASSPFSAGTKIYENFSKYTTNTMDKFHMTVQNIETGELSHFQVKEKKKRKNGKEIVEFDMKMIKDALPEETEEELIKIVSNMDKQKGGFDWRTEDFSDDIMDEYKCRRLIDRFTYFYLPYVKMVGMSPNDYEHLFMPVFVYPIAPVMVARFDLFRR